MSASERGLGVATNGIAPRALRFLGRRLWVRRRPFRALHELIARGDLDGISNRTGDRAMLGVERVYSLYGLRVSAVCPEPVVRMYPLNDEYFPLKLYFAGDIGSKIVPTGFYSARFQRAPEGAGESTTCSRHDVIKRGGVRPVVIFGYSVMLRHF
jgi:hypothetical protein